MAEQIRAKGTPSVAPSVVVEPPAASVALAAPPKVPSLDDSPVYREAVARRERVRGEVARLERLANEIEAARRDMIAGHVARVRAVVDGASVSDVRPSYQDARHSQTLRDLHLARQALEVAERELQRTAGEVKDEIASPFASFFRAKTRAAALAYLAFARAAAELDDLTDELLAVELHTYGGCDRNALPRFPGGNPKFKDSMFAQVARDLIEADVIDEQADAALLAGLAVAPPRQVYVPPKPPKRKEHDGVLSKFFQSVGALPKRADKPADPDGWGG